MHWEDKHPIVFQTDKVVITRANGAIDLELVFDFFEYLHMLGVHDEYSIVVQAFWHD